MSPYALLALLDNQSANSILRLRSMTSFINNQTKHMIHHTDHVHIVARQVMGENLSLNIARHNALLITIVAATAIAFITSNRSVAPKINQNLKCDDHESQGAVYPLCNFNTSATSQSSDHRPSPV